MGEKRIQKCRNGVLVNLLCIAKAKLSSTLSNSAGCSKFNLFFEYVKSLNNGLISGNNNKIWSFKEVLALVSSTFNEKMIYI